MLTSSIVIIHFLTNLITMTRKFIALIVTACLNAAFVNNIEVLTSSDSDIYIYGKVYTDDDEVYEGQIRWGKEEAFWFDHFNSSKPENENLDYLSKKELRSLNDGHNVSEIKSLFNWDVSWGNDHTHSFSCEFGNIKAIEIGRRDRIEVELKNGDKLELEGGSNDIGTYVQVTDNNIGHIKVDWDRIERVEFMQAPAGYESHYGAPLYGTVEVESGEEFTGYVQWDHDERLANDELNGKNRDGEIDLEFGKIKSIERGIRSANVTTLSGRTLKLKGTNDVNDGNRGIIVNIPGLGRVDIPWDEFEKVTFSDPKMGVINYADYDAARDIQGSVKTEDGETLSGRIVYDLDEAYQFEILNGKKDDIEYFIPFQLIKSIDPTSRRRTLVTLKSGKEIKLEDSVDVNDDHDGILVFDSGDEPKYIPWYDIEKISF